MNQSFNTLDSLLVLLASDYLGTLNVINMLYINYLALFFSSSLLCSLFSTLIDFPKFHIIDNLNF